MVRTLIALCLIALFIPAGFSFSQKRIDLLQKSEFDDIPMGQPVDGSPWNPDSDPDIDMYLGNYRDSQPKITHGTLIERDILTKGDNMNPPAKGALLIHINRLTHAMLPTGTSTEPVTLKGEQELFYTISGRGVVKTGDQSIQIHPNICFLVPANLEFILSNTGDEPLLLFLVSEPIPEGFEPNDEIRAIDEGREPVTSSNGLWTHVLKGLFRKSDGFGTIFNVLTVETDAMTLYWPHSHFPGCEEVWVAMKGTSLAWIGKQVRPQPPGTAYIIPNDRRTIHCNINTSEETVKFFYFSTRKHMEPGTDYYKMNLERSRKKSPDSSAKTFGETYLDPTSYTPGVDPDIDMYLRNWKESMPRHTHGSLVERDILMKGDPMNPKTGGAVLKYANRFVRASLTPYTSTSPTTLKGEQEIFYIISGRGLLKTGTKITDLYKGIAILMPAELEFTIRNTGGEDLTMYLINEPIPEGFKPNKEIVVKDESALPVNTGGHWCHIVRTLFTPSDGLGSLHSILTVAFDPMTIGHPHTYFTDSEEVWTALEGSSVAFLGKQLRLQHPGTAYLVPPDGKITHSNINQSYEQIKFFYFLRSGDPNYPK